MHSHKIDSLELNGIPAESMESLLGSEEPKSWERIVVVPMFFGPSRAITDWLPRHLHAWKKDSPGRSFEILDCLHHEGDNAIALALFENTTACIDEFGMDRPFVALVDHGTPLKSVNAVREEVGRQLQEMLGSSIRGFSTCCMERRDGPEFDFNDPLLEDLLQKLDASGREEVVVAQLFLSPGRHAGKRGDLEKICSSFAGKVVRTELLGMHPKIIDVLERRVRTFRERKSAGED